MYLWGDIMALIKCPECGKDISDMSQICIHCGFPLSKKHNDNICVINNKEYDLEDIKNRLLSIDRNNTSESNELIWELKDMLEPISLRATVELAKCILETGAVPEVFDVTPFTTQIQLDSPIKCPKCFSTQITTGSRGYSLAWGFIGANKTVNRCAKCGHSWQPKK